MIAKEKANVTVSKSTQAVTLAGTGSALPDRVVSNAVFEKRLETSDGWIRARTGIRERRIARASESTSTYAARAARSALDSAGMAAADVELIVLSTTTPDVRFPATANVVQGKLGAVNAYAYDISVACSGFIFALASAQAQIQAGMANCALVIAADLYSSITDFEDRNTCVLFGDGAGAVMIEKCRWPTRLQRLGRSRRGQVADCRLKDGAAARRLRSGQGAFPGSRFICEPLGHHLEGKASSEPTWATPSPRDETSGILAVSLHSNPNYTNALTCEGAGTAGRSNLRATNAGTIRMDGKTIFKLAVKGLTAAAREVLDRAGHDMADVACIIPHQANIRIIERVAQRLGCGKDKFMLNLDRYGNTSSASVPIALDEAVRSGRVAPGDLVLLAAAGAGFSYGAILLRI